MPLIFQDNENEYLEWIAQNPEALVVNCRKKATPGYMVLHRANCTYISKYKANQQTGGFTERGYIKICGHTEIELKKTLKKYGAEEFSKICSCCYK
jgi:hypothetical protein